MQLRSIIVTCPDDLREQLRGLTAGRLIQRCSRLRRSSSRTPDELATILVLRSLARRIEAATAEAAELESEILGHIRALTPQLLEEAGVGPIVAAQLIVAWSHQGRVRSEAAFARLAGVAPIPASSGQTIRHRLSRGGDRQLNRALHTVILHRRSHGPTTKDYIARRVAEGKSRRDATRLLKRYLARSCYRLLQGSTAKMWSSIPLDLERTAVDLAELSLRCDASIRLEVPRKGCPISTADYTVVMSSRRSRKSQPFSIRLGEQADLLVRDEGRRLGRSRSVIVEELAEEAAKTRLFPGVAFRGTPRRAWAIGSGLDIWELVDLLRSYDGDEGGLRESHSLVTERHLRLARTYAERFPEEIATILEEQRRPLAELQALYPFLRVGD